ncbi:MAG TPA: 4Fe-4S dicluster domain-containing protein, partial [Armatimonadota bacterium]|nr:4Fe-4S dicluster domain-containing protein [Armatimonadota bacterium]
HGDSQHRRSLAQTTALGERESHREVRLPLPAGFDENDFYPGHEHKGSRWVMVVDLDRCIGCNACVAACYAENNVAVVGEEGVRRNRVMAWLRIDRYFDWSQSRTPIIFQPMLCQHCDVAPCESVCPVYAAAHSEEGINMQVYNRCVGTRYCSNNCPYKVRRFNWFQFTWPEPLNWQLNPDVTVRDRGVMEKCTFCIQRIREAQIIAKREHRALRDDEIIPACVQTCPTGAFTFGDLNNPDSRVSRLFKQDPRAYQALYELNTKPGVVYLRRIIDSE